MTERRTRLARLSAVALAPLLSLTLAAPAMAARAGGDDPGEEGGKKPKPSEVKPCPTDKWTVPLEVQGLACLLLLPKKDGAGGGGAGGLLG